MAVAAPTLSVVRGDNGNAKFIYTDGAYTQSALGFWDDAAPWASGSYVLDFSRKASTQLQSFRLENVANRTGILIHGGAATSWSDGSLIVDQSFIDAIYSDLSSQGVAVTSDTSSPVALTVTGDFAVGISVSATAKVNAGDNISVKVALVGPGAAHGLSKDVYVKLRADSSGAKPGEAAVEGVDFELLDALKGEVSIKNFGTGWIKILKGTTSTTVNAESVQTSASYAAAASVRNTTISVADYQIADVFSNYTALYHDETNILNPASFAPAAVEIDYSASVIGQSVNANGGNEGYDITAQFAPGQGLSLFFDPYTIPDDLKISTDKGIVLLDTGFIGGKTYSGNLTVPGNGDGKLRIQVLTNDPGTVWSLTIDPLKTIPKAHLTQTSGLVEGIAAIPGTAPANAADPSSGNATLAAAVAGTAPFLVMQNSHLILKGASNGVGANFSIILNDASWAGKTVNWSLEPSGSKPGSLADFPAGTETKGSFIIPQTANIGQTIFSHEFTAPAMVSQAGGIESFDVNFFESLSGSQLRNVYGNPVHASFDVTDAFTLTNMKLGSDSANTINGGVLDDVVHGGLGNDTIVTGAGNDIIYDDAGNDFVNAGDGNDRIVLSFGTDSIDGGAGVDTVYIPRKSSDVTITTDARKKTTIVDNAIVPLGTKFLTNVERVVFSDTVVNLSTNATPNITVSNITKSTMSVSAGNKYTGPVVGLAYEYIDVSSDNLNLTSGIANTFLHTGSGTDSIDVSGAGGNNVLDGGTNSNFLVGGTSTSNTDTFFVDDRAPPSDIWSTVVNFHANDYATVFGITQKGFTTIWTDNEGATGYTGLTLHVTAAGAPTASLTLAGYHLADMTSGRITTTFATEADGTPYLYVKGA